MARERGKTQRRGGLGTLRLPWNAPNGFVSFSEQLDQQEARRRIDGNGDVAATARGGWSDLRRTRRRKHPPQGAKALKCVHVCFRNVLKLYFEALVCIQYKSTWSSFEEAQVCKYAYSTKSTWSSFRFVLFSRGGWRRESDSREQWQSILAALLVAGPVTRYSPRDTWTKKCTIFFLFSHILTN